MILFQTFIFADNRIGGTLCPALKGLELLVRIGSIVCKHRVGYLELVADISAIVYLHRLCACGLGFCFTRDGDPCLGCETSCYNTNQNSGYRNRHFPSLSLCLSLFLFFLCTSSLSCQSGGMQQCNGMKTLLRCDSNATQTDPTLAGCGGRSQCKLCNDYMCSEPNLPGGTRSLAHTSIPNTSVSLTSRDPRVCAGAYGTCLGTKNGVPCTYDCAPGYVSKQVHLQCLCSAFHPWTLWFKAHMQPCVLICSLLLRATNRSSASMASGWTSIRSVHGG